MNEERFVIKLPKGDLTGGKEYFTDVDGRVAIFDDEDLATQVLLDNVSGDRMDYADYVYCIGTCKKCGAPLFPSDNPEYESQCFDCDEDFYSIEQEVEKK